MEELFADCFYESNLKFSQWWKDNQQNIDSAIEKYLQEQGKEIIESRRLEILRKSVSDYYEQMKSKLS